MARAVGVLFNSRVVELCASLPQHQQLFMCAAVLHFREEAAARAAPRPAALLLAPVKRVEGAGASGRTTVRKLYQAYATLCRAQQVRPISLSEIVPACQALASSGMLHIAAPGKRKAGAAAGVHDGGALDSTVSLAIQESELQLAVKEVRFFRQILQPAPSAQPGAQPGAQQGAHPSTQP
jgi:cell division control protein 6